MSSNRQLTEITARVREFIGLSVGRCKSPTPTPADRHVEFNALALDLFALQYEHNAPYRRFCRARGAAPPNVEHWDQIPAAPASAFKELELSCLPATERSTVFHSSGTTTDQPSRHFHSAESLALYEASVLAGFDAVLPINRPHHPLILTPSPALAPHSSLVHMFETIRRAWHAPQRAFVGNVASDGGWVLDLEAAVQFLLSEGGVSASSSFSSSSSSSSSFSSSNPIAISTTKSAAPPLLLLGTAFSFVHLLDHLEARGLRLQLPPGSGAMETGGYKGRSRTLPKPELYRLITHHLGIPASNIICEYGMSELSSQAYDSPRALGSLHHQPPRHFHFPPWARVQLISPETGREVPDGETGLLRIFDLANVFSLMPVQTEDLGVRHGRAFELLGRASLAEPRGCSLMPGLQV